MGARLRIAFKLTTVVVWIRGGRGERRLVEEGVRLESGWNGIRTAETEDTPKGTRCERLLGLVFAFLAARFRADGAG